MEKEIVTKINPNHILIIDDDKIIREILEATVNRLGYDSYTAENGEEGLKIYEMQQSSICGIILDIVMPKKNGFEVYSEIRQINPLEKILFSTGLRKKEILTSYFNMKDMGNMENVDFLQKPYNKEEIKDKFSYLKINKN